MSESSERAELKFDGYAIAEPVGEWEYELNDLGVRYGRGSWPSHGCDGRGSWPCSVRLAPNTEYKSWRTQFVLLTLVPKGLVVFATLQVFVRPQGLGGWVHDAHAEMRLSPDEWTWRNPLPADIRRQAKVKRDKVLKFLCLARQERDAGQRAPVTAHERYQAALANVRSQ
jgi:hypothetical protein